MSERDTSATSDQLWIFEGLALLLIVAVLLACWVYIAFGNYERLKPPPPKPAETAATTEPAGATIEPATATTEPVTTPDPAPAD